jgi:hypothetical protein
MIKGPRKNIISLSAAGRSDTMPVASFPAFFQAYSPPLRLWLSMNRIIPPSACSIIYDRYQKDDGGFSHQGRYEVNFSIPYSSEAAHT